MAAISYSTTAADASFSATGAQVFTRMLLAAQAPGSPAPVWTLPDVDATILYQGVAAQLASLRLSSAAYGSPSLGVPRALFADDSGDVSAPAALTYNPTFSNSLPGLNALVPLHVTHEITGSVSGYPALRSFVTVNPSSDVTGVINQSAAQLRINKTGAGAYPFLTAADIYATVRSAGSIQAMIGASCWAENEAAATVGGIIGATFIARQSHSGAISTDITAALVDPSDGHDESVLLYGSPLPAWVDPNTKAGINKRFTGLKITGMNLDSMVTEQRRALWIRPMSGTPSGSPTSDVIDLAIHSEAEQTSRIEGPLQLGKASSSTGFLIFSTQSSDATFVQRPAAGTGTWTAQWPADSGTDGYFMRTNGSGVMSWDRVPVAMFGGLNGSTVAAASKAYVHPFAYNNNAGSTEASRQVPAPCGFKLTGFKLITLGNQPSENALIATLRINGVATALQVTVPGGGAAGAYTTSGSPDPVVSVSPNQLLALEFDNSAGSPGSTSASIGSWSFQIIPS